MFTTGASPAAGAPGGAAEVVDGPTRTVVAVLALPPGGGKSSLYAALRACGARINRHVLKLEAGEDFRIAGDDAIDIFLKSYLLDDALRLEDTHADRSSYWWFQRAMLATRLRVHHAHPPLAPFFGLSGGGIWKSIVKLFASIRFELLSTNGEKILFK